jgi:hypothetical protein
VKWPSPAVGAGSGRITVSRKAERTLGRVWHARGMKLLRQFRHEAGLNRAGFKVCRSSCDVTHAPN